MSKKLVLYGCGYIGKMWAEHLGDDVSYFADSSSDKWGHYIFGKKVLSLDELIELKDDIEIFISTSFEIKEEIYKILVKQGLNKAVVGAPYLNKDLYVDWNTSIDESTVFEGRNSLKLNSSLYNCYLGYASYVAANSNLNNVKVGKYSCIGPNVNLVLGQHPTEKFVSIHPVFYSTQRLIGESYVDENIFEEYRYTKHGYSVEIGNDVWIGANVSIMEGVTISDGTIVAAGANVVKDTEPYSIVGGNPAKLIRYRFEQEDIEFLLSLQWWNRGVSWIDEHAKYFDNIEKLKANMQK